MSIITKLYNGDEAAFDELITEYEIKMQGAPEDVSSDEDVMPKRYWKAQIDWLKERFPEGKYQDVIGLCRVERLEGEDGIVDQDYSLNAGRYVGVVIEDDGLSYEEYCNNLRSIHKEYLELSEEATVLSEDIRNNLEHLVGGGK